MPDLFEQLSEMHIHVFLDSSHFKISDVASQVEGLVYNVSTRSPEAVHRFYAKQQLNAHISIDALRISQFFFTLEH